MSLIKKTSEILEGIVIARCIVPKQSRFSLKLENEITKTSFRCLYSLLLCIDSDFSQILL
jgi:hypothetical protein